MRIIISLVRVGSPRLNANHYDSQLRGMDANVTDCNKWNDPGQRASNEYHRHNGMNQRNSYNLNGTNLMRLHPMNMGNEARPAEGFLGHERRNMRNKYPRPIMAGDGYPAVIQPAVCGWEVSWNPDDGLYYIENLVGVVQTKIKDWRNVCQWCNKHSH